MNWKSELEVAIDQRSHLDEKIWKDEIFRIVRVKCLEAIKNTRYEAIEILHNYSQSPTTYIENQIQNIDNNKVMPKL